MQDHFPNLQKTVFIVTYGRSGSTLVQNLLNALPGACIRGENDNLLGPLARAWDMLRYSPQSIKMRDETLVTDPADPWFGFEEATSDRFGEALARAFTETFLRPGPKTRIAGFKEIRWHNDPLLFPIMLDFLRAYFPKAHILFNLRNHAAVCRSGWWKTMKPEVVQRQLQQAEALYAAYGGRNPDACLTLRYENYVTGPDAWRPLFEFLDEPFDADLVHKVLARKLTHLKPVKD